MDLSKFENNNGVYLNDEMVESWDGLKLNLVRQFISDSPKAILIILHGLANNLTLYDDFVKPFINANIGVYRYDARGHGKSEGKRGYVKSYWEMVDDLKVIVELAKKENPNIPVFVLGHSMGGHVAALFGTKYPDAVRGIILAAGVLRYNLTNFGYLPRPEAPDTRINTIDAAYGTLHLPEWKTMKEFSKPGDTSTLTEIYPAILNAFKEGIAYLKTHRDTFCNSVMILNGNGDDSVSPKDAIEFYEQTVAKDKSLFIYAGVSHFLMADIKGHMIAGDVLNWIEDRLVNTVYEEFEF